ncbi:23_t:CDS:2 [Acaulospora colombiana]|uniref:23_t:CDS:1 n=1 Tax=Acaulospora colombiana TaxID=27376 RepID=A0ACA9NDL1_9GLOM|nr:23_t:CDS:2 [Acaulospora colombiana]
MSTTETTETKPTEHIFVIWAPDYTDDDAINRRLAVPLLYRYESYPSIMYSTGVNGPFLSAESIATPDAPKKMWDKEKLVIAPFLTSAEYVVASFNPHFLTDLSKPLGCSQINLHRLSMSDEI